MNTTPAVATQTFWKGATSRGFPAQDLSTISLPVLRPSVRSSGIEDLRTCPRKFMYRYRLGLASRAYKSAPSRGTWFHELYGYLLLGYGLQQALLIASTELEGEQDLLKSQVNKAGILPWGAPLERILETMIKDHSVGTAAAVWAWNRHPLDTSIWEVIAVESLIKVKVKITPKDPWTTIRIRVDAILKNRSTGKLWFMDHKTTSTDTIKKAESFLFATQPQLYRYVLEQAFPRQEVEGVIHMVVQIPAIRQRLAKQPETWTQYLDRLNTELSERQDTWELLKGQTTSTTKGPPLLISEIKFLATDPLDEELACTIREASSASRSKLSLGRFHRNSHACFNWMSTCEYLPLCSTPIKSWQYLIPDLYDIRPRDQEDDLRLPSLPSSFKSSF